MHRTSGLPMLIALLLASAILVVLTADLLGAACFIVGYGIGWAHSALRSP